MKAALFFRLPEDQEDFKNACLGAAYKAALDNMDEYLRKRLKYEDGLSDEVREALRAARGELFDHMQEAMSR